MKPSTLLIDLDDTLYPASCGLWGVIRTRIGLYIMDRLGISAEKAQQVRNDLFKQYGTTLRGLQTVYQIDEEDYLQYVHDVPLKDYIHPDPLLRQVLSAFPQRKVIFTNADANHAHRVLDVLGLEDLFEQIIDIHSFQPYCKPMPESFLIALDRLNENAGQCVLVDDSLPNLAAAHALGFYTVWISDKPANGEVDVAIPSAHLLGSALPAV